MPPRSTFHARAGHERVAEEARRIVTEDLSGGSSPASLDDRGAWVRWDGTRGTARELTDGALATCRAAVEDGEEGWVALGEKRGVRFEYDPRRTASLSRGNRFFRLTYTLKAPPRAIIAALLDPEMLVRMDATVRYGFAIHEFEATPDSHTRLFTVCASAGPRPLFLDRDDLSFTGWRRDADGTFWQVSVSVPSHTRSVSTAVRDQTMYWAYKLQPFDAGGGVQHTRATLVSATEIFGWLPKFAVNRIIPHVLADYLVTLDETLNKLKEDELKDLIEAARLPA